MKTLDIYVKNIYMINIVAIALILAAICFPPTTSYGEGYIYDEINIKESNINIRLLEREAKQGSIQAMRKLANFYSKNNNAEKAKKWYRLAFSKGDGRSALLLIALHDSKKVTLENRDKIKKVALAYINENVNNGNAAAALFLGREYKKGKIFEKDYDKAHFWLLKADSLGSVYATYLLGMSYVDGIYKNINPHNGFRYFVKAANAGLAKATRQVAIAYMSGIGIEQDIMKAGKYYKKAAQQGDILSMLDYANFLKKYDNNTKEYLYWLKQAEKAGNQDAAYYLGMFYKKTNPNKAKMYFKKATANKKHHLSEIEMSKWH